MQNTIIQETIYRNTNNPKFNKIQNTKIQIYKYTKYKNQIQILKIIYNTKIPEFQNTKIQNMQNKKYRKQKQK